MKKIIALLLLIVILAMPSFAAYAQEPTVEPTEPPTVTETPVPTEPPTVEPTEPPTVTPEPIIPHVVSSTRPVDGDLKTAVDDWLAVSPPSDAVYYGITYTQPHGHNAWYVCVVGLAIDEPNQHWSFAKDGAKSDVMWAGTVIVSKHDNGTYSVEMYANDPGMARHGIKAMARPVKEAPVYAAGGGPYVRFPWEPQKSVIFGAIGIHGVGYDQDLEDGWRAIDLVSGTDYGIGAADDRVFTSVGGTIDMVCKDDQSVAVRITGGGDSFVYGHLLDNENLAIDEEIGDYEVLGQLRHGSFSGILSGDCGNAVQAANHWHLHWGFIIEEQGGGDNGNFQAEGCILTIAIGAGGFGLYVGTGAWVCGVDLRIPPNQPLIHYGNIDDIINYGSDDNGAFSVTENMPSFWTLLLEGALGPIFDAFVGNVLPEHESHSSMLSPILTSVKIVFRITQVLMFGYFNLGPAIVWISGAIAANLFLSAIYYLGALLRIIKQLPGVV